MAEHQPSPLSDPSTDAQGHRDGQPGPRLSRWQRYNLLIGAVAALLFGVGLAVLVTGRPAERRGAVAPPRWPPLSRQVAAPEELPDPIVFNTQLDWLKHTPSLLPAEAPQIFCFYDLPNLPADTQIRPYWWLNGDQLGEVGSPAQVVTPVLRHAKGRFVLTPPGGQKAFPEGIYEVELRAGGRRIEQASFVVAAGAEKILSAQPTAVGQVKVISCVAAQGVNDKGEPEGPTTTFAGTDRIYVVFTYIHGTAKSAFKVTWVFQDTLIEQATQRVAMSDGAGRAFAWMHPSEPLPAGQYRVEVMRTKDEQPLATAKFTIKP